MSGSSVAAMVVGTIFIMIFGMATVSMIESIDDSVEVAEYKLPDPEVDITSVTDKVESTGPAKTLTLSVGGTGYTNQTCATSSDGDGVNLEVTVETEEGDGIVTGYSAITNQGSGYSSSGGETVTVLCGGPSGDDAEFLVASVEDKITIIINNTGSEAVELSHIYITLSDTSTFTQGTPFQFSSNYSGPNTFIFPGEEITSDSFLLETNSHGFAVDQDPNRAFLAVYDYRSAVLVTTT